MAQISIKGFPISIGRYEDYINKIFQLALQKKSSYVCVANVHMFIESLQKKSFLEVVSKATLVTPDGMPIVWALKGLYGIQQQRVSGMDLICDILKEANNRRSSVFIYGGTENMLQQSVRHVHEYYPNVHLAGFYSPPFRKLTEEENSEVIKRIEQSGACIVLVILGCPKQELWMASMKGKINAVMVGVGGALPVMVGLQHRAPVWMQNAGLEWFYRLLQEPKRLFRRYAVTNSLFIMMFIKEWFRVRLLN